MYVQERVNKMLLRCPITASKVMHFSESELEYRKSYQRIQIVCQGKLGTGRLRDQYGLNFSLNSECWVIKYPLNEQPGYSRNGIPIQGQISNVGRTAGKTQNIPRENHADDFKLLRTNIIYHGK